MTTVLAIVALTLADNLVGPLVVVRILAMVLVAQPMAAALRTGQVDRKERRLGFAFGCTAYRVVGTLLEACPWLGFDT